MSALGFVEIGARIFEVILTEGPIRRNTRDYKSFVDYKQQQIQVSDLVPEHDRPLAVGQAVSAACRHFQPGWTAVPVVGVIR